MAVCTVSFSTDRLSLSDVVEFHPLPNQVVDNVFIDITPITAEINGANGYQAALTQKAKYKVWSNRFYFGRGIFTCPASSTANLYDLLEGARKG